VRGEREGGKKRLSVCDLLRRCCRSEASALEEKEEKEGREEKRREEKRREEKKVGKVKDCFMDKTALPDPRKRSVTFQSLLCCRRRKEKK
jgi:hypothetical protein